MKLFLKSLYKLPPCQNSRERERKKPSKICHNVLPRTKENIQEALPPSNISIAWASTVQYRISSSAPRLKSLRIEHPARRQRQYNGQRSVCIFHLPWSTYVLPAIFLHQMKLKFFAVEKWPKLSQPVLPSLFLSSFLRLAAINILARKREPIKKKYIYSLSLRFFMKSRMLHFLGIKCERIKMARKEARRAEVGGAGGGDVAATVLPVPAR